MCIHVHSELLSEIDFWHDQGMKNVSGVQMYTQSGRFVGSWVCFLDQPQSVAQAVHALRTWHPGPHRVSLELLNEMRWEFDRNLPTLRVKDLPKPEPLAVAGLRDDDSRSPAETRALVTQWLNAARSAAFARA